MGLHGIFGDILLAMCFIIIIGCLGCFILGGIEGIYQYTHQKNDTNTYNETVITDENYKNNSYAITGTIIIEEK